MLVPRVGPTYPTHSAVGPISLLWSSYRIPSKFFHMSIAEWSIHPLNPIAPNPVPLFRAFPMMHNNDRDTASRESHHSFVFVYTGQPLNKYPGGGFCRIRKVDQDIAVDVIVRRILYIQSRSIDRIPAPEDVEDKPMIRSFQPAVVKPIVAR
jgi:hypothetical protein